MAVVNVLATVVANLNREKVSGLPNNLNASFLFDGRIRQQSALLPLTAGDSDNSVYRFARVRSDARISAINVVAAAIVGFTAADFGVYDIADNGGAVVSQHLFSTAQDLHAGNTAPLNQRWVNLGAASAEQQLWQMLGLAADPGKLYDLAMTATTRGANAGSVAVETNAVDNRG